MSAEAAEKTGEIVKPDQAVARIEAMIGQNKGQMAALLGKNISVERLFQIAMTAVSRVPKLKECTTASVLGCVMESSRLRLPAGVGAGGTWLIPRQNKNVGAMECTLIVDYRAIILMMKRDAGVETVIAEGVREKDHFKYGVGASGPFLEWTPAEGERGKTKGYVAASWNKAGKLTGVIYKTVDEINRDSKGRAGAADSGPWKNDPDWMYKKSVIRPLGKLNPGIESDDLSRAITLDERAEMDLPQNLHLLADASGKVHEDGEAKTYTAPPAQEKGREPSAADKIAWAREAAGKQGVSGETFDAWIAQQPGDEAAKAAAVVEAWKPVQAKKAKAVDVFKAAEETEVTFKVSATATTEFFGEQAYVVRSAPDEERHYTSDEAVYEAARAAKKAEKEMTVKWKPIIKDGKTYRWLV